MRHEIERDIKYEIKEKLDRELSNIQADEQQLRKILDRAEKENKMEEEHRECSIPKARIALCIMLLGLLAAIPVSASVLKNIRGTVRITEENRELVGKELYTATTEEPAEKEEEDRGEMISIESQYMTNEEATEQTGGIIQEIGAGDDGNPCLLKSTVITPVPLEESREGEKWLIESLLSNNGDVTVFTKENGDGWYLEAGQTLTIRYCIDPSAVDSGDVNDGEQMSIGYIFNHVFYNYQQHRKAKEFTYTLTAPEPGIYYLYNQNCCAGYIYLTEGTIEAGK